MLRLVRRLPLPVGLLVFGRIMLLLSLPLEGIQGFGDFVHFYNVANLPGIPFISYWSEYPPIISYLSYFINILAQHQEHVFFYLFALILVLVDTLNLFFFMKILQNLHPDTTDHDWRVWVYLVILIALPYCWWYLDPLVELTMIISIWAILEGKASKAGIFIALGVLTKFFPIVLLPAVWKYFDRKKAIICTGIAVGISGFIILAFVFLSPDYTFASLQAQFRKGSSETIWALMDGNLVTGNFGNLSERRNPAAATRLMHNPSVISPAVTLVVFLGFGLWQFLRIKRLNKPQMLAFMGFTWSLLLMWSSTWSPQWLLYLIPLLLLTLPQEVGILMLVTMVFTNLLEWPVLLGRGYYQGLWVTIIFRTLTFILVGILWYEDLTKNTATNTGPGGDPQLPG
jgi:hypothetical protein